MAVAKIPLSPWLRKKIVDPFLQILSRGAEPKQLAFSGALGITLGIFPICGVTVLLCGMAIALLGSLCHSPTVILANFVATPIELSLVVPFLRLGEVFSGGTHFPLTSDALKKVLTGHASHEVILSIAHAIAKTVQKLGNDTFCLSEVDFEEGVLGFCLTVAFTSLSFADRELLGWLIAAPFFLGILYIIFLPIFKILVPKFSSTPSSPSKLPHLHSEIKLKVRDV